MNQLAASLSERIFVKNTFIDVRPEAEKRPQILQRAKTVPVGVCETVNEEDPQEENPFEECNEEDQLPESKPLLSQGSAAHASGECIPCAFNHQTGGCPQGKECGFCHECDEEAYIRRRRQARDAAKLALVPPPRRKIGAKPRAVGR